MVELLYDKSFGSKTFNKAFVDQTKILMREPNQMLKSTCLCCSDILLRHVNSKGVYWFCNHCYQEMPNPASILGRFSR